MKSILALLATLLLSPLAGLHADDIDLVRDGKTDFCIVQPAMSSKVDGYAVTRLADYLKQITGAEFPVLEAKAVGERSHCLFVGISPAVVERLGGNPLETLQDQEHVARSKGGDVFLYGKGIHGNLHAVMEFLENSLGLRWYSIFEKPVIPAKPSVTLNEFIADGYAIDGRTESGCTALMLAASGGHEDIVQTLIDAGADVNATDDRTGLTPLMWNLSALHSDEVYLAMSRRLLAAGADAAIESNDGKSASDWARERKNSELIVLLNGE